MVTGLRRMLSDTREAVTTTWSTSTLLVLRAMVIPCAEAELTVNSWLLKPIELTTRVRGSFCDVFK